MAERGSSYEGRPPPPSYDQGGERRVALVIGNGAYSHAAPLDNPVRDAEAFAGRLTKLGFDVVKGLDLDLRRIGDVQAQFEDMLRRSPEVALLFYAGHGLQVDGRNYLIPVDAEITQKAHLASRALLFNDLLSDMADNASASLIFLDACRDNPFTRNLARSLGESARSASVRGGLARIEKVAGTFIAYATAPDQVAFDGKGQNSPFTSALLEYIETPGLSVGDLMIDVRNKVLEETNGRQEPWDQSSLRARFYFAPPEPDPPRPASDAASEWTVIQGTTSLAVLAAFQERYPDPPWNSYAEARAKELRAADAARQELADADHQKDVEEWLSEVTAQRRTDASLLPPPLPEPPSGNTMAGQNVLRKQSGGSSRSRFLIAGGVLAVVLVVTFAILRPLTPSGPQVNAQVSDSEALKEDPVAAQLRCFHDAPTSRRVNSGETSSQKRESHKFKPTIVLDAAFGSSDDRPNEREVDRSLELVKSLADSLREDYNVVLTRATSKAVSLAMRQKLIKDSKPSAIVSIQQSADPRGMMIIMPTAEQTQDLELSFSNSIGSLSQQEMDTIKSAKEDPEKIDFMLSNLGRLDLASTKMRNRDFSASLAKNLCVDENMVRSLNMDLFSYPATFALIALPVNYKFQGGLDKYYAESLSVRIEATIRTYFEQPASRLPQ